MRSFLFYMGFLEAVRRDSNVGGCHYSTETQKCFLFFHKTITIWFYTNGNYIVWKGRIRRELLE